MAVTLRIGRKVHLSQRRSRCLLICWAVRSLVLLVNFLVVLVEVLGLLVDVFRYIVR